MGKRNLHTENVDTEGAPTFTNLGLSQPILDSIADMGYIFPTRIQIEAIPYILMGRDVMAVAQTGTGKTASFTLPLLEILIGSRARARMPRSLILEPTRELALQVSNNFIQYGRYLKLNHALLIGGESMAEQREVLNRGVDVLIATPGRLLDTFERGAVLLSQIRTFIIDEADRMLDMGFIPDVEKIARLLPSSRQTLLFSATMAPEIKRLTDAFLTDPKQIEIAPPSSVAQTIEVGLFVVSEQMKHEALRQIIKSYDVQGALVFCNRKRDVDILARSLNRHQIPAMALHGDLNQTQRFHALEKFRAGEIKVLVCSDVVARGIDIDGLSHVFNFDIPRHPEDYVHRIGRTGRAGKVGHAFTIATPDQREFIIAIEKLTCQTIPRLQLEKFPVLEWEGESDDIAFQGQDSKQRTQYSRRTKKGKSSQNQETAFVTLSPAYESTDSFDYPAVIKGEDRNNSKQDESLLQGTCKSSDLERGFGNFVPRFMLYAKRRKYEFTDS